MIDFTMEFLQPLFFTIFTLSQFTVIITTLIFCGKLLKPKPNEKEKTQSMASRASVGPDGKPLAQQVPSASGAPPPTAPDGKKPDDAAGGKKSEEKKPDAAAAGATGDKKSEKKDDGAAPKKNDLDQSKGKQNTKEDDGGGEGYENCNEMTPSQLQKIANETK